MTMHDVGGRRSARREDVLAVLRPDSVLAHFGIAARTFGDEVRLRICPTCGPRSRDCVCIDRITGHWFDHAHGCKGDIFSLVGGLAGIDCNVDFPAVLRLAAQIAGVELTPPSMPLGPQSKAANESDTHPRSPSLDDLQPAELSRDEVMRRVSAVWKRLHEATAAGTTYLERRGLGLLAKRVDLVRHGPLEADPMTPWGRNVAKLFGRPAVCVPVHAVDDNTIINVVARRLELRSEADPKVVSLPAIKKVLNGRLLGTFGSWSTFRDKPRDVVIVEGVFDYLTAVSLWPDKLVVGADGASLLPKIGQLVAADIARTQTRALVIPHNDPSGFDNNKSACLALLAAGVRRDQIQIVDLGRHKDLNDAHVAGEAPDVS